MKFNKRTFPVKSLIIPYLLILVTSVFADYVHGQTTARLVAGKKKDNVIITIKRNGDTGGCVEVDASEFRCSPAHSLVITEDGTATYKAFRVSKSKANALSEFLRKASRN